ncbi:hypothetical protein FEM48_Zijuj07G0014400 [Ziziphus jujuba var. spinosa]|uniref:PGG domain-containing protein n=1 Tax=Ziziphus jujuba var. spinosa TaxID=714518 RepID=A0A978V1M9_ZIZJJ|nr:hypothetical protein FEM48_Zijuj07G0014400 [Ziziphus jujuba var. spinosa]
MSSKALISIYARRLILSRSSLASMDPLPSQTRKNAHILFQSVMKSKWKEVVEMYDDEEVHKAKITKLGATALHVAVSEGDKDTVEKLVAAICRRDKEALKIQNDKGNTALHIAASVGHKESCKFMLDADPSLAGVRNKEGETPLFTAALRGKKDVFLYLNLFCISDSEYDYRNRNNGDNVLHVAIDREYFDLAYQIIHLYNNDKDFLTRENDEGVTPFKVLATKSSAFKSGTNLGRWKRLIYKCIFVNIDDKLIETKPLNPQSEESKNNGRTRHVEYTKSIKTQEEDSMTDIENHSAGPTGCQSTTPCSNEKRNIFHFKKVIPKVTLDILGQGMISYEDTVTFAMEERELQTDRGIHFEDQHGKENDKKADGSTILVATKNGVIEIVDKMLHYFPVAIEDRNFVRSSIPPRIAINRNKYGKTPEDVFTETHKELLEHGSSWLIKTSESCSVVAALIAGVAFASSSSIPGGTIDDSGKPIFENHPAFQVFTIASLLALCFSVTSLVMFLAIITSRFQEKDFNKDLPLKLLIGLTSLFVAIGAMLICFCSGHFLMIEDKLRYAAFPVYAMTCLPVSIFAAAQFPLYLDLFWTTFMNPFDYLHRYK